MSMSVAWPAVQEIAILISRGGNMRMLKSVLLFCLLMVSVYGCSKHINGITAIRYDKMNINSLEEDDGFVLENKTS